MAKLSDVVTVTINVDTPKPQVPVRKYKMDTVYTIAGRSFREYIFRRLEKDGIGFTAKDTYQESATDLYSHISAPVPQNDCDFLAYCHELGHCKSRQYATSTNFYHATWNGKWGMERLVSEVNAWKWALRYFRRLGYSLEEKTIGVVQWALNSYFSNAADLSVASKLSKEFEQYSGIATKVPEPVSNNIPSFKQYTTATSFWVDESTSLNRPKKACQEDVKPVNWKPWHDLKQKQMKKQWKHCK